VSTDDETAAAGRRIVVLADDLIWSSRLVAVVGAAGAVAVPARRREDLPAAFARAAGALVDLTSRGYDGVAAVSDLVAAGIPVICVAQHDDRDLHRRALAAGADRVLAYRAVHERGAALLAGWPRPATQGEGTA
jgi:DNA-binding NarL/FixJ family response regulator